MCTALSAFLLRIDLQRFDRVVLPSAALRIAPEERCSRLGSTLTDCMHSRLSAVPIGHVASPSDTLVRRKVSGV